VGLVLLVIPEIQTAGLAALAEVLVEVAHPVLEQQIKVMTAEMTRLQVILVKAAAEVLAVLAVTVLLQ
jgi:NADH:ubiquinone oxidoreductase subunit D